MDRINLRLATPEEVARLAATSDITATARVLAHGDDLAVIRGCIEVDPIHFADESIHRKASTVHAIERFIRSAGTCEYYFEVDPDDHEWVKMVERWGARRVYNKPAIRYKRSL